MSVSITEFGRSSDGTVIHRATLKNEQIPLYQLHL